MALFHQILIAFVIVAVVAGAATNYRLQSRIQGGSEAEQPQFPHNVAFLVEFGMVLGGGSILSDRIILTAATVMEEFVDKPEELIVSFDKKLTDYDDSTMAQIDKVVLHPEFNRKNLANNLAIVRTEKTIRFSMAIQPISLPATDFPIEDGQLVTVNGWGLLEEPSKMNPVKLADRLQYLSMKTIGFKECLRRFAKVDSQNHTDFESRLGQENICTANRKNEGLCDGDIGNGLVFQGELVGVASWNFGCGNAFPDVYTKVFPYKNWVQIQMHFLTPPLKQ